MEEQLIKVYVKLDSNNVIIAINSNLFIADTTGWIQIDEGAGDKYSHAQGNYFTIDNKKPLIDSNGEYNYKLVDGKVIERTEGEKVNLDEIKQNKMQELSDICNSEILKGFYSDADGTNKLYDFDLENQVNLSAYKSNILLAKLSGTPLTTVSYYAKGESCHDYTADQFLKLASDAETFKLTTISKYKDKLKPMVLACTTVDEVNAISWNTDTSTSSDTTASSSTVTNTNTTTS